MDRNGEKYKKARQLLSKDIDLAVKTAFSSGADTVYYLDGHGGGGNVIEEMIDARAVKCSITDWTELLKCGKIDCLIELGSHARAGTIGGFLDHTMSSKSWFSHRINGQEMSELSMHAIFCSVYNVPIVACTGDEAACRQAKEYIPEIITGAVKTASTRNLARDYENANEILITTVRNALANYKTVPVYQTKMPITVELTYYRTDMCETDLLHCGTDVVRKDARTLSKTLTQITQYADLRF